LGTAAVCARAYVKLRQRRALAGPAGAVWMPRTLQGEASGVEQGTGSSFSSDVARMPAANTAGQMQSMTEDGSYAGVGSSMRSEDDEDASLLPQGPAQQTEVDGKPDEAKPGLQDFMRGA